MEQLKVLANRFKNPTVFVSIVSEIVVLLSMFNIDVDADQIYIFATAISTILITLGVMSNPDTENKTFLDDIKFCKNCGKKSRHVLVNGQFICKDCGAAEVIEEIASQIVNDATIVEIAQIDINNLLDEKNQKNNVVETEKIVSKNFVETNNL